MAKKRKEPRATIDQSARRLIDERIRADGPNATGYFLVGDVICFWSRAMIGEFLTSEDQLFAEMTRQLIEGGCRVFASHEELKDTIVVERWEGWDTWLAEAAER